MSFQKISATHNVPAKPKPANDPEPKPLFDQPPAPARELPDEQKPGGKS